MQGHLQTLLAKESGNAHGSHYVVWVPLNTFNNLPIAPWKFNRPPDTGRVEEIRSSMRETKRMDGIIYLACIENQLVCYESNHRRLALKEGMPEPMPAILVDILWDATDERIVEEFKRLNKAISVPDLYVDPTAGEPASVVIAAVEAFCAKYPGLRSPSGRPNRPNYNRDILTQNLIQLTKELHVGIEELMRRLEARNAVLAGSDSSRLKPAVAEKCRASGLWLFAVSGTLHAKDLA